MRMIPIVYFMTLPSYVDRRHCLLLEKSLHSLCITIYVHSNIFTKLHVFAVVFSLQFFDSIVYNLNGPVVIALASKSDAQSSSHTRILKKDLVCLQLAYSSLINVFINPETSPPLPSCCLQKSQVQKTEGGEYNPSVEVSVNSKEKNS